MTTTASRLVTGCVTYPCSRPRRRAGASCWSLVIRRCTHAREHQAHSGVLECEANRPRQGLTLTLKVTAYDNGMVEVDGIPINVEPTYDQGHGWLGAADVITTTLNEFRKDAAARRRGRAAKQ